MNEPTHINATDKFQKWVGLLNKISEWNHKIVTMFTQLSTQWLRGIWSGKIPRSTPSLSSFLHSSARVSFPVLKPKFPQYNKLASMFN